MNYLWSGAVLPHGKCQEGIKTGKCHSITYISRDTEKEAVLPRLQHTSIHALSPCGPFRNTHSRTCVEIRRGGGSKPQNDKKNPKRFPKPPTKTPKPTQKTNTHPKATSFYESGKAPLGSSLESSAAEVATAPLRLMSRGNKSRPARDNSCWSNQQRWDLQED